MKYLVIKKFNDGECFVVKPNQFLSLDEARSLQSMLSRTDNNREYIIVEKV